MRLRSLWGVLLVAFALAVTALPAFAHPCDSDPDDPRCGGDPPTGTNPPGSRLGFNVVTGSNGQRYVTEAFGVNFNMGGGELHRWGTPSDSRYSRYWDRFEQVGPSDATVIWWYILTRGATADPLVDPSDAMAEVDHVVAQLIERRPDATIYVTGMGDYAVAPTGECNPTPDRAQWAAQYALDTYPEVVQPGPPIDAFTVVDLAADGCHPGSDSLAAGAVALIDWWATVNPGD